MKGVFKRISESKTLSILLVAIIIIFAVVLVRITFAYFKPQWNEASKNVRVASDKVDKLSFRAGDAMQLLATSSNLTLNGSNLNTSTTVGASLLAGEKNGVAVNATHSYRINLNITKNTFKYIQGTTPEIILTLEKVENGVTSEPVLSVSGLTCGTYNGVKGCDITTKTGNINLITTAISSNSSSTATDVSWNVTITYLNQNYDQSANYGNELKCEVVIGKEE